MTRVTMQGERVPLLAREGTPARLVCVRDESVAKTTRWSRLAMMATGAVALVGVVGHATGGLRSARSENHLGLGPSTVPYNNQYKGPLFIHIPKNGGTAIELLAAYNGVRYVSGGHKEGLFQESEVFFCRTLSWTNQHRPRPHRPFAKTPPRASSTHGRTPKSIIPSNTRVTVLTTRACPTGDPDTNHPDLVALICFSIPKVYHQKSNLTLPPTPNRLGMCAATNRGNFEFDFGYSTVPGLSCNVWHRPPLPPAFKGTNGEVKRGVLANSFCVSRNPFDRLASQYRYRSGIDSTHAPPGTCVGFSDFLDEHLDDMASNALLACLRKGAVAPEECQYHIRARLTRENKVRTSQVPCLPPLVDYSTGNVYQYSQLLRVQNYSTPILKTRD